MNRRNFIRNSLCFTGIALCPIIKSNVWPVAPIDLTFDNKRKVWTPLLRDNDLITLAQKGPVRNKTFKLYKTLEIQDDFDIQNCTFYIKHDHCAIWLNHNNKCKFNNNLLYYKEGTLLTKDSPNVNFYA